MDGITRTLSSNPSVQAYRAQVSILENDPNATSAFKEQLERQVQAVEDQIDIQSATQPSDDPLPVIRTSDDSSPGASDTGLSSPAVVPPPSDDADKDRPAGGGIPVELERLAPEITRAAAVTGDSPELLSAQIWQESRGETDAVTTNGGTGQPDAGVMQVDSATFADLQNKHPELQGKSLSDPLTNIEAGGFYFQDLKRAFGGSDELALRAYNSGPGSVDRNDPDVTTTGLGDPTYVQKVESIARDIESGTPLPP